MPFDGGARWQIEIMAADKTAAAFASVDRRMRDFAATAKQQAAGFAAAANATPASQASAYARLANETARAKGVAEVNRLAEQSVASLAALYGGGAVQAASLAKANDKVARTIEPFPGLYQNAEVAQNRFVQMGVTRLSGLAKGAIGATVALVAVEKVLSSGFEIGGLGDQATQLGVTTDQLQAFRLEASRSGVSVEQLDGAILKLQGQMAAAKAGDDEAIARFERLGVKVLGADGRLRDVATVMPEVARGALRMGDEIERNGLLQEVLGKSGRSTITMMESWSRGSAEMVAGAKEMNAVASGDTVRAWNAVDSQLKVVEQQFKVLIATFGLPIAMTHLRHLEMVLGGINTTVQAIKSGWSWMTSGVPAGDLQKRADTIMATIQAMESGAAGTVDDIGRARLKGLWSEWNKLQNDIANQQTAAFVPDMPAIEVKGDRNPVGKAASAAGAKLDGRLKELQDERAALEKALAAFDVRGLETVDQIDRRLTGQVQMSKKIFDVLKDVPSNSPLAQQLTQEATAVSQLNLRLDERKRLLSDAEQVSARFGDGSRIAARETERLNQMLAAGAIDAATYERALKATTQAADDQARAARGAAGGFDGFLAGFEQGMADVSRANSAFDLGKRGVDMLGESIDILAGKSSKTFGQMAADFGMMLLKWEIAAQASNIWNSITGKGATNQGLFGSLLSGIGGLFGGGSGNWGIGSVGGAYNGGGSMSFGGPRAAGGPVNPGSWYMVGEKGPEPFIPHTSGTILPNSALRGAAPSLIVNVHNYGNNQVRAEQSAGPGGMPKLDVFVDAIDGAFAKKLDRGVGPTSEVLKGRYGLQAVGRR